MSSETFFTERLLNDDSLLHARLGLHAHGLDVIENPERIRVGADPHLALFKVCLESGHYVHLAFAAFDLSGRAPAERSFSDFAAMNALYRKRISPDLRDQSLYYASSGLYLEGRKKSQDCPLIMSWGVSHALHCIMDPSQALRVASSELAAGLLSLTGQGWQCVHLGRFTSPEASAEHLLAPAMERFRIAESAQSPTMAQTPRARSL